MDERELGLIIVCCIGVLAWYVYNEPTQVVWFLKRLAISSTCAIIGWVVIQFVL